jgi:cell wall-associated NlpC family hydrolase
MSKFTDDVFAPVLVQVEQVVSERDGLKAQVAGLQRDQKLAALLIASDYYEGYTPKIDYVFGGEDLKGMDCSGFMLNVFKEIGVKLPRVSADQIKAGQSIPVGQEQAGDLLGFDLGTRNGAGIEHIGMCCGNGMMIHTAKKGEGIVVSDYHKRYGDKLVAVARVY